MRIGLVTGEYPPMQGGVGAYTHILAKQFVRMGHEVAIFSSQGAQHELESISITAQIQPWNIPAVFAVRSWAKENDLEVINLQFETAAYQMSPWIHFLPDVLRPIPVITTFHDLLVPYLFPKAGKLRRWIVNRLARVSSGVILTNQEDMLNLKNHPKAALIPIGSNILSELAADYQQDTWRAKVNVDQNTFLIAYFGFMNHTKGVDTLLNALKLLCENRRNIHLVVIGGRTGSSDPTNAAYAMTVDQMIEQNRLPVTWTGFVDDVEVASYLHAADVVCLPYKDGASFRRGTLMAAIQQGCAIITTTPAVDIPSFQQGVNMLLVPPDDPEALAEAIGNIMDNPQHLIHLREGTQKLKQHFQWDYIVAACIDHFQHVLGN